jgi:hypothetical protein
MVRLRPSSLSGHEKLGLDKRTTTRKLSVEFSFLSFGLCILRRVNVLKLRLRRLVFYDVQSTLLSEQFGSSNMVSSLLLRRRPYRLSSESSIFTRVWSKT